MTSITNQFLTNYKIRRILLYIVFPGCHVFERAIRGNLSISQTQCRLFYEF